MLLIKSTTQAYLPCFFSLSTVVSQAVYNFPQRQWHKPSYSIPFQFPDCCSLYYEKDSPLWIQQTSCAASTYKWRETWHETQATLWLLIEHMILLTCQKISFAIQIELMDGCLSSSLVGCVLYGIGYIMNPYKSEPSTDERVANHSVIAE